MAKDPIFPLYYNDIDRSTRDWTDEEFGCYMRLLMHQWAQGEIPKETQRLARIVTSLDKNWLLIRKKFIETETGMINENLERIRSERESFRKKQQENGKKGGRKPKQNPNINPNDNPKQNLHIEVEIEKEIEVRNIEGGTGGERKGPLFEDVHRVFVQQGGTKQMAEHFFNKHSATGWLSNGQPIKSYSYLITNFINNWRQNEKSKRNPRDAWKLDGSPGTAYDPL